MKDEDHPKQDSGTKDSGWGRGETEWWERMGDNREKQETEGGKGERNAYMHLCVLKGYNMYWWDEGSKGEFINSCIIFSFDYKMGRNVYFFLQEKKIETVLVHVIWVSFDIY